MLNEGSAPVAAYGGGAKQVIFAREMSGDDGENFQREAIDRDERVPPLADSR